MLISGQIYILTIYVHIGVVNSGRQDSPHIRKSSLDHDSGGKNRGCHKSGSLSPQKTPTSNFISGGPRQPTNRQRGGGSQWTQYKSISPPLFRAYWNHRTTFIFFSSGPSSVPLTLHIFFPTTLARAVAFVLYFCARAVASSYTGLCMLQDLLLFPCAGGADPSLVRDPCQAREQANNPCQELLGSLRDDPRASQPHASTARYASEPQLAGQLRRAVLA